VKNLDIVTTLYNSRATIAKFLREIEKVSVNIRNDENLSISSVRLIVVDDGSSDKGLYECIEYQPQNFEILTIELTRNFGHHPALRCGIEASDAEYVVLIDSDLEEPPHTIEQLITKIVENPEFDCVYAIQRLRKGGLFERISGKAFYKLTNFFAPGVFVPNACTLRVMSRKFTSALLMYNEKAYVIGGVWTDVGFKTASLQIDKTSKGTSAYSLSKKLSLALTSITSFSNKPLSYLAILAMIASVLVVVSSFAFVAAGLRAGSIPGWASIVILISVHNLITTLQMTLTGVYTASIFKEVKNRPSTIIKEITKNEQRIDIDRLKNPQNRSHRNG
jgi:putative glycosyltransferase